MNKIQHIVAVLLFVTIFWIFGSSTEASDLFRIEKNSISTYLHGNNFSDHSPVNPGNIIALDKQWADLKYNPSFSLYLGDSGYIFSSIRANTLFSDLANESLIDLEECFISLEPVSQLNIDFGKKNLLWGTAYAWNVAYPFQNKPIFQTPLPEYDLILFMQYFENESQSFSLLSFYQKEDAAIKYRFSTVDQDTEIMITLKDKLGAGLALSRSFDQFELHIEPRIQNGSREFYPHQPAPSIYTWSQTQKDAGYFIPFLIGGTYTTDNYWNILLEYFHNPLGLSQHDFDIFQNGINESSTFMLQSHLYYQFAMFRQNYLFFRSAKEDIWGMADFSVSSFLSLDDTGFMLIPEIVYPISGYWKLSCKAYLPIGSNSSEFKRLFDQYVEILSLIEF